MYLQMVEDTDFYDELMESEDPDKMQKIRYEALLDATGYFGMMDLLAAEPSPYDVRTLTYVHMYAIGNANTYSSKSHGGRKLEYRLSCAFRSCPYRASFHPM